MYLDYLIHFYRWKTSEKNNREYFPFGMFTKIILTVNYSKTRN